MGEWFAFCRILLPIQKFNGKIRKNLQFLIEIFSYWVYNKVNVFYYDFLLEKVKELYEYVVQS